jgi:N-acetyl-gamma-glutamyl-phosphate reductase
MRVGVVGASGYAGGELLRLLAQHPKFEVSLIAAGSSAGERITSIHPHLTTYQDQNFQSTAPEEMGELDLVFVALPHGESSKIVSQIPKQVRIVDLGADFRLTSPSAWEKYYGSEHPGKWVYGLPELPNSRKSIAAANRVANPGCYATAIVISIAPILDFIDVSDVVAVAASGTTGAGRSGKISLSASEVANSLTSYKFGGIHQHTPEIEEALSGVAKQAIAISFTPILAPIPRGILSTVTARTNFSDKEIRAAFQEFTKNENFLTLLSSGDMPKTASVIGSNSVHLQCAVDIHTSRVVVSAAIDNLGKGAAGQAIQNANLMFGFDESMGLSSIGIGQ